MKKTILLPITLCLTVFMIVKAADKNIVKVDNKPQTDEEKVVTAVSEIASKVVTPKKTRKILIFSRTMGYRHRSIGIGQKTLALLGKESGAYSVVVSDDLANFEKPVIDQFDAICFLNTTLNVFGSKKKLKTEDAKNESKETELRLKKNLANFVSGGKGFIGIHAATDTFYEWPEYGNLIGGYFDKHPWTSNTDVVINVEKGMENHPLNSGFKTGKLSFKEEIYQFKDPYDSKKLNILTRLNTDESNMKVSNIKRTDNDFGTSWYKEYGEGRVFYCSLGHNNHIYYNSEILAHYLAGIQYALGDLELKK